jgi:guanidinoacetate N-methyltransferase
MYGTKYNKPGSGVAPGGVNAGMTVAQEGAVPLTDDITNTARQNIGTVWSGDEQDKWKKADIDINDDYLKIQGHPVMERWEEPYMHKLAEIATCQGGKVLEVGFGMAISAGYIQSYDIDEHHIIEANEQVQARADKFAENARHKTFVHRGFSWDVAPNLEPGSFDGIMYDTYPLSAGATNKHQQGFFEDAGRLLRPGGFFTYFCNEPDRVQDDEVELLKKAGFRVVISFSCPVPTPDDCQYWRAKTIVAPLCIKE